jgi:CheY-like chemotaxis protein
MNKKGEIVIVDDDIEDCELFTESLQKLGIINKEVCFQTVKDALDYLRKVDSDPFIIISDLRMPIINGFEFRQMMYADENLIKKAIPFVLFSLNISSADFNTALSVVCRVSS